MPGVDFRASRASGVNLQGRFAFKIFKVKRPNSTPRHVEGMRAARSHIVRILRGWGFRPRYPADDDGHDDGHDDAGDDGDDAADAEVEDNAAGDADVVDDEGTR